MRVVAVDVVIGDRPLRTLSYNYSADTGRLSRMQVPTHLLSYLVNRLFLC